MKSSGNSSAKATRGSSAPERSSFALTGRSVVLDPRRNAVRRDIADIRLAEYVFAPHYVVPMVRAIATPATLRAERDEASETIVQLSAGEIFEVLDIAGKSAWGIAVSHALVGYIDKAALDPAASV